MPQIKHRIDLRNINFPLTVHELGRTVLIPNANNVSSGEAPNPPQALYAHNVMPTLNGVNSIAFLDRILAPTGGFATTDFESVRLILSDIGGRIYLGITASGTEYYTKDVGGIGVGTWRQDPIISTGTANTSIAHVVGTSYIYINDAFGSVTVYQYQASFPTLVALALVGSPLSDIEGIVGSHGYLIAWGDRNQINWSSLVNPLDLTPSAVTGAGVAAIDGLEGQIQFCLPTSDGFLAYAENNVVALTYTGNKKFPFKATPITNAKGTTDKTKVAYDHEAKSHFAFTSSGMQSIDHRKAENVTPEITQFLDGRIIEDFDTGTNTFNVTSIATGNNMLKKVRYVSSRYLVVSYGATEFTHALIYDLTLEKIGKIKFTHVDCFDFVSFANYDTSQETLAFVDKTGYTVAVSLTNNTATKDGVLILGKYQFIRDRHLILHKASFEDIDAADTFDVIDLYSLDGRNFSAKTGIEKSFTNYRDFYFTQSGVNHMLAITGDFNLITGELLFAVGGRR